MRERTSRVAATVLLGLTLSSGSAFGAPPADSPGKSGDAPGHQKEPGSPAEPKGDASEPKGDASEPKGDASEPNGDGSEPKDAPTVDVAPPAELQAPAPAAESPRFTNAAGKPKHNVPAAAEAAPEASVSAPGNSGRHKLTICHKGHAITVDVHAARAHVDGHGDTYAVAGAKGRAACPHSSGPTPRNETPSGPGALPLDPSAVDAGAGRGTNDPGVAPAVVSDPHAAPTVGVSEATSEQSAAGASGVAGVAGVSLPFTGARLDLLLLFGLALVTGGALLRRLSLGWTPRRSSSR